MAPENIFQPIATKSPPSVIPTRSDHPVPRLCIQPQTSPIGTNKFYANFFLGSQTAPTWTHPYSVSWSKGGGTSRSWGLSVQHIDASQRIFSPITNTGAIQFFVSPLGVQTLVLSASELGSSTAVSIDSVTAFSANISLLAGPGLQAAITFPLVQGMGFVTAIYDNYSPILQSGVFFRTITKCIIPPKFGITKHKIVLEDGQIWLLYAYSPEVAEFDLTLVNKGLAQAGSKFKGIIQVAKDPGGNAEVVYDAACGTYPTTTKLSGSSNGVTGSYTMTFERAGLPDTALVMFALPHHVESFNVKTTSALTTVKLHTTTKGIATAVVANSWTLIEDLPITMGFAPWSPAVGAVDARRRTFSAAAIDRLSAIAASELSQNMFQQTDTSSMYFSGKVSLIGSHIKTPLIRQAFAKFAGIVYTLRDLVQNLTLAESGLAELKACFAQFASNKQHFPLTYETAWGGIVSEGSYITGNPIADFGNTYYNDHHFQYGYFIYTAAVIGYLDPSWLPANIDYVNALVRDIANPSTDDTFFPVSRMFDWYHGHSWSQGLYESSHGKDEESSSEDAMSAYAIKMWGRTIGDLKMEARGNLQLALTAHSLQSYFLYLGSNKIQPAQFIGNKCSGILFENRIDHTTYFGSRIAYIQGIHMLPLLPCSTLTRSQAFVREEWGKFFSRGRAELEPGSWKGILFANLAIIDPEASWQFFSQNGFSARWLDAGASLTWYLAMAAGLGGCP